MLIETREIKVLDGFNSEIKSFTNEVPKGKYLEITSHVLADRVANILVKGDWIGLNFKEVESKNSSFRTIKLFGTIPESTALEKAFIDIVLTT